MINLVPAKCPNCGSNLELDDNLKRTECSHCKTIIIVDEAIQKYELEVSGKVEVDGIKTDKKRLEEAKKHIKIEEYVQAKKLLDEILKNDHFNIEAQCEWIKSVILFYKLDKNKIDYTSTRQEESEKWSFINEIIDRYKKLIKLDEAKEYEKYLKDYTEIIENFEVEYNQILEDERKCKVLSDRINKIIKDAGIDNAFDYTVNSLRNFFESDGIQRYTSYAPQHGYDKLRYRLERVELYRNGSMKLTYVKDRRPYFEDISYYPERITQYAKTNKMLSSISELEGVVNEYLEVIPKEIEKINKKNKRKVNMENLLGLGYFVGIGLIIFLVLKFIFSGV